MIKAEWTNKDALDLQPTCNQLATTEGDFINRADAINCIKWGEGVTDVIGRIKALPSADIQEVESATIHNEGITFSYRKKGEWIKEDDYGDLFVCSECGFANDYKDNYCPNCGADMRGDSDG